MYTYFFNCKNYFYNFNKKIYYGSAFWATKMENS